MPYLRFLFGHVYRQFHELPQRGHRSGSPRKRYCRSDPSQQGTVIHTSCPTNRGELRAYYQDGDESVLPRNIATRAAFLNAMTLDIAMGGSTNTVLHLLAIAQEAGVDFTIQDIDSLSRKSPVLCKVAPNSHYHIQDVNRAGGILSILAILEKEGLIDASVRRVDRLSLTEAIEQYAIRNGTCSPEAERLWKSAPGNRFNLVMGSQENYYDKLDTDRSKGCIRDFEHAYVKDGGLAVLFGNIAQDGCIVKTAGVDETHFPLQGKSQSIRIAGRGLRRHTRRESRERRRGRHHLRRPQRRPRHARDALPYLVYQIETPRQSLCPHYRRAFLRWDIGTFHRTYLARSSRRRKHRISAERRPHRNRHSQPQHQPAYRRNRNGTSQSRRKYPGKRGIHPSTQNTKHIESPASLCSLSKLGRQRCCTNYLRNRVPIVQNDYGNRENKRSGSAHQIAHRRKDRVYIRISGRSHHAPYSMFSTIIETN